MQIFLLLDQGTTSTRGFVLAEDGTGTSTCTREHQQ